MVNRLALAAAGITALFAAGTGLVLAGAAVPTAVPTASPVPVASGTALSLPPSSAPTTDPTSDPTSDPTDGPTTSGSATPTSIAASTDVGPEEAASIALAHVGGGRVTEIESEFEHGRHEWKVEVVDGRVEHDVRVDATTGAITRTDRDDD